MSKLLDNPEVPLGDNPSRGLDLAKLDGDIQPNTPDITDQSKLERKEGGTTIHPRAVFNSVSDEEGSDTRRSL
jgi:hypothetical protein